ncbi:MAG: mechanosensitive ion channel [Pseudomonadales bacterium]
MQASEKSVLDDVIQSDQVTEALLALVDWARTYLLNFAVLIQVGLIVAALVPAVIFGPRLKRLIREHLSTRMKADFSRRLTDALAELATPIALYLTLTAIRIGLGSADQPMDWVAAALSLMNAWIAVRVVTLVIRSRFWSRVAFYIAWPIAALDAVGMLGPVVEQLQQLAIPLGRGESGEPIRFSLLDVIRTLIYFAMLFWGASTLGRILQQRLEAVEELSPSLKALISKILNITLPVIALVIALQVAGFNLATLAVFSGAVGLGIGLGLQRIASNFIAGFTLIADRSIKPGDVIEIEGTFGWVTAMQARYVAIRTRDGTEKLIPNDRFVTEGVTNWSRTDRIVRLHAPFGVSYRTDDMRQVQALAIEAALGADRVLENPAPVCNLTEYGNSSVNFDLRFWISDPQNGMANVRSQVLMTLWELLKENDIEIPFPQRDVHIRTWNDPPSPRA